MYNVLKYKVFISCVAKACHSFRLDQPDMSLNGFKYESNGLTMQGTTKIACKTRMPSCGYYILS